MQPIEIHMGADHVIVMRLFRCNGVSPQAVVVLHHELEEVIGLLQLASDARYKEFN